VEPAKSGGAQQALAQEANMEKLSVLLDNPGAVQRAARQLFQRYETTAKQQQRDRFGRIMVVNVPSGVFPSARVKEAVEQVYSSFGADPAQVESKFKDIMQAAPDMNLQQFTQYQHTLEVLRDVVFPKSRIDRRFLIERKTGQQLRESYDIGAKLGSGAFGTVYRAVAKSDGKVVVIKEMKLQPGAPMEQLRKEVDIMRLLDHMYVVRIFECFEERDTMYVAMEHVQGKDLMEVLQDSYKGTAFTGPATTPATDDYALDEVWVSKVIRQVLEAVAYCHAQSVMHKDLKLQNVMVICDANGRPRNPTHCVVLDFGFAEVFTPHRRDYVPSGSPMFCAPEVFRRNFSNKCDVWSVGVMAYCLMTGRFPFEPNPADLPNLQRMLLGPQSANWSPLDGANVSADAKQFCRRLVDKDERRRPEAKTCLQDGWFFSKRMTRASMAPQLMNHLLDFQNQSFVLRAIQNLLAAKMDTGDVQVNRINRLFASLDKDKDGVLTSDELAEGLRQLGVNQDQISGVVSALAMDGTGTVTYTNFLAACVRKSIATLEGSLMHAFNQFDRKNEGRLSIGDFSNLLAGHQTQFKALLPDGKTCEEICQMADRDGTGQISFDEFKAFILEQHNASIPDVDSVPATMLNEDDPTIASRLPPSG